MRDLYPFTVRLQDGREWDGRAHSVGSAETHAQVALDGAVKIGPNGCANPAVLVIRGDEPFLLHRSWLRRLVDRWIP